MNSAPRKEDKTMKSNAMKSFAINAILGILSFNGMLLLLSAIDYTPFRFNPCWGVVVPILCAAICTFTPSRKAGSM